MSSTNMSQYLYMDEWCSKNKFQTITRVAELLMEGSVVDPPFRVVCGLVKGYLTIVVLGVDHVDSMLEDAFPNGFEMDGSEWIQEAIPAAVMHAHVDKGGDLPEIGSSVFFSSIMAGQFNVIGSITHVDPTDDLINSINLN